MALEPAFKKWLHCSKPPFMKTGIRGSLVWITLLATLLQGGMAAAGELTLTIYNQNFAVVRDKVALELRKGTNQVRFAEATAFVEPSSVILRDPSGKHQFQVLEQNYRGDPISQDMMLALNEGKTVDFEIIHSEAGQTRRELIPGRIVRSGRSGSYSRPRNLRVAFINYTNTSHSQRFLPKTETVARGGHAREYPSRFESRSTQGCIKR